MHGVDQPVHLKNLSKRGLTDSKASRSTHKVRINTCKLKIKIKLVIRLRGGSNVCPQYMF